MDDKWQNTDYGKVSDYLFGELVLLNHLMFYVERIGTFPNGFLERDEQIFWEHVPEVLIDEIIIIGFRAFTDKRHSPQRASATTFRELAIQTGANEEERRTIEEAINAKGFAISLSQLTRKIAKIRHNLVAHQNLDEVLKHGKQYLRVSRSDFEGIFSPAAAMYEAVVTSVEGPRDFIYWYHAYRKEQQSERSTPLDGLLQLVASNSRKLHLPESNALSWKYYREGMSPNELDTFNDYRRRAGLAPVN